jgi:hypothetical protein
MYIYTYICQAQYFEAAGSETEETIGHSCLPLFFSSSLPPLTAMFDLSYEGNKAYESVNTTAIETNGFILTEINKK